VISFRIKSSRKPKVLSSCLIESTRFVLLKIVAVGWEAFSSKFQEENSAWVV
jgi:hypothetical protein